MHFNRQDAAAFAGLAASALDIEAEPPGAVASHFGILRVGKQRADVAKHACVGGRVGARRAANRRLVDIDNLIDALDALDFFIRTHRARRAVNGIRKGRRNGVGNQGALARSRHAGNNRKRTKLDFGSNVFEVVGSSARNFKAAATGLAPFIRHPDHSFTGQISARHRLGTRHDIGRRSRGDHVSAVHARAGAHVDHIVGSTNRILIMLDYDY